MSDFEPKKLTILRILQILENYTDEEHKLTQAQIIKLLDDEYGIQLARAAVSRNISWLINAGYDISEEEGGGYKLISRTLEEAELRVLIDGVLSSRYITASHSKQLISKLCGLSSKYFRSRTKHISTVNDWGKTENPNLFYNIEIIDEAIESRRRIKVNYSKYGNDLKLHRTSTMELSPYQMFLRNQRYYLMALNEKHKNIGYYRVDKITNAEMIVNSKITDIHSIKGYENGIDYKDISLSRPYMFSDDTVTVTIIADEFMINDIVDWFGKDISVTPAENGKITVRIKTSPTAMEFWAKQYMDNVEVISPKSLRRTIHESLINGLKKYRIDEEK